MFTACALVKPEPPRLPQRSELTPGATVTVRGNQNIYAVARENNVSMRDIIVLNNLQPPFTVGPGQRLVLPAGSSSASNSAPYNNGARNYAPPSSPVSHGAVESAPLAPIETAPLPPPARVEQPKQKDVLVAPVTSAPVESLNEPVPPPKPMQTTAAPSPPALSAPLDETPMPSVTMAWPVKGPILSSFGPKGQGLNNDGINIGAPKGAPVVAASNGIVVYAGNEMKGFGNLVLIRHGGGWVTAYAHLDRMLVSKDAVVAQGDMIGTVGKTGNVPSPQLHFETRYQGKPVDPSSVIK